jgi:hypothetical protein
MTLNPDIVRARCSEIEEAIRRLEPYGVMSADAFVADRDRVDAALTR